MIISFKHKFIFLKTRKTAGSSIEAALYPLLGPDDICTGSEADGTPAKNNRLGYTGHVGWQYVKNLVSDEQWNEFYKFAIERNSYDKVVSDYLFQNNRYTGSYSSLDSYLAVTGGCSDWGRYTNQDIPVVDLFRYENELDRCLDKLKKKCGVDLIKPFKSYRLKKNNDRKHYSQYYDKWSKQFVHNRFKREIEYFGYQFETK